MPLRVHEPVASSEVCTYQTLLDYTQVPSVGGEVHSAVLSDAIPIYMSPVLLSRGSSKYDVSEVFLQVVMILGIERAISFL